VNISLLADYAQGKQSYIGYSEIDFGVFFASQTQHVALMKVKFDVEKSINFFTATQKLYYICVTSIEFWNINVPLGHVPCPCG